MIEISEKRSHGKKLVVVRRLGVDGDVLERVHEVPQGKRIGVFTGDEIRRSTDYDGQLDPKDILSYFGRTS